MILQPVLRAIPGTCIVKIVSDNGATLASDTSSVILATRIDLNDREVIKIMPDEGNRIKVMVGAPKTHTTQNYYRHIN